MLKNKPLHPIILSFLALVLLQLSSGIALFISKYGYSTESLMGFYMGPQGIPFSLDHHLDIAVPHSLALGVCLFVFTHFFLFVPRKHPWLLVALWLLAYSNCFFGIFLIATGPVLLWLKPVLFVGFQLCFVWLVFLLIKEMSSANQSNLAANL